MEEDLKTGLPVNFLFACQVKMLDSRRTIRYNNAVKRARRCAQR